MPRPPEMSADLSAITREFPASDWREAFAGLLRQSQLDQDRAARLLHDSVGQNLSAFGLELSVLLVEFKDRVPELAARVTGLQNLLEGTIDQVRAISRLHPSPVDQAGLRFALEHLVASRRNIRLDYPEGFRVPREPARALFRVGGSSIEHASLCGANEIRVQVSKDTLGWVLEVLYDVTSPSDFRNAPANIRLSLLLVDYHAIRSGIRVVLENLPGGVTGLRAIYGPEAESSQTGE